MQKKNGKELNINNNYFAITNSSPPSIQQLFNMLTFPCSSKTDVPLIASSALMKHKLDTFANEVATQGIKKLYFIRKGGPRFIRLPIPRAILQAEETANRYAIRSF